MPELPRRLSPRRWLLALFYRLNPGDVTITHHYTGDRVRLHSYKHKGYWFHGKGRETEVMELFGRLIRPGDTVLEVGGHIGYVALYLSDLVGPSGKVLVLEPGSNNLPYLKRNVGEKPNVTLVEKAAGSKNESRTFYMEDITGLNNSFARDYTAQRLESNRALVGARDQRVQEAVVSVVRLDDFLRERGVRPDFVKIDVESAELDVLRGAERMLAESHPLLMVEVQPQNSASVRTLLDAAGYLVIQPRGVTPVRGTTGFEGNLFCLHEQAHSEAIRELGLPAREH